MISQICHSKNTEGQISYRNLESDFEHLAILIGARPWIRPWLKQLDSCKIVDCFDVLDYLVAINFPHSWWFSISKTRFGSNRGRFLWSRLFYNLNHISNKRSLSLRVSLWWHRLLSKSLMIYAKVSYPIDLIFQNDSRNYNVFEMKVK